MVVFKPFQDDGGSDNSLQSALQFNRGFLFKGRRNLEFHTSIFKSDIQDCRNLCQQLSEFGSANTILLCQTGGSHTLNLLPRQIRFMFKISKQSRDSGRMAGAYINGN